ncbi:MAG: methyltransferase domain-containing protein [Acidimicrobiia bacterium]|nr:methyltransferase domain-containing protein [Acidimicrobiia bacterium]
MDGAGGLYETIGRGYATARPPDPRIANQIEEAIGGGDSVVNVGAGTGNYEPPDRQVVAVEPSPSMLRQRRNKHATVRAIAERLPFVDDAFDVAMAIFTIHHWTNRDLGLQELARVARRQVSLVYDTDVTARMWLIEYFPELTTALWDVDAPGPSSIGLHLEVDDVRVLWVPPDCTDGFTGAYWNRPERYLEAAVQAGMSTLTRLDPGARAAGGERLRRAIESGDWDHRHGWLRSEERFDMGYRLVLSHRRPRWP